MGERPCACPANHAPCGIGGHGPRFEEDGPIQSLSRFKEKGKRANSIGGGLAFELSVPNVSLCPLAGVGYSRLHEEQLGQEATATQIVVPSESASANVLRLVRISSLLYSPNQRSCTSTRNSISTPLWQSAKRPTAQTSLAPISE